MMTLLQREEIRRGREAHLSEEAMAVFADPRLNYRKMRVLRTALNDGIDPGLLKPLARTWIPEWKLEELTEEIRKGNLPEPPGRPFPLRMVLAGIFAAGLCLPLPFLLSPQDEPELELTAEEVRLSCVMTFDPAAYVRNADAVEEAGGVLILPEAFTADMPGTRLVQYRLEGNGTTMRRNLRITVTDETAPVLKLKTEKTELLKEAPFSCQSYVFSAEDNVDRDLKDQVICSDVLQDTETQEVRYTVKDSAGNEAHAVLAVHFADYGEPLREAETERVASVSPAASVPTRTAPPVTVIEPVLS